jgi:hypothetical protein
MHRLRGGQVQQRPQPELVHAMRARVFRAHNRITRVLAVPCRALQLERWSLTVRAVRSGQVSGPRQPDLVHELQLRIFQLAERESLVLDLPSWPIQP